MTMPSKAKHLIFDIDANIGTCFPINLRIDERFQLKSRANRYCRYELEFDA
jgi:hypothetical protein